MATLIICPACGARYEIAAAIPPGGRKVRCSKCSHVWQAVAVVEGAKPPAPQAVRPQPAQAPAPSFAAPPPQAAAPAVQPRSVAPQAPAPGPAPASPTLGRFPEFPPSEPNGRMPGKAPPPPAPADAAFSAADEFQADVQGDAGMDGIPVSGQEFGSFNAGVLTNPAADAFQTNIPITPQRKKAKMPPAVAIGWGLLTLLLLILAALWVFAPRSVVAVLPGAARLYAMVGNPVGLGVGIQDVHYAWVDADGAPVLKVEGTVVNRSAAQVIVPGVVIELMDETGKPISEVTAPKPAPLEAGASMPFAAQIASPPKTVRSLKVSLVKAG